MEAQEKKNIPILRFPDFLNDREWEVKRLGEIITVNSGRDYKHLQSGDIPVYGTGGYMLSVNDKLSDIDAIGIGRKGTIDKPQYLKAPFWTVDTLFFLTTKEGYDLNFVFCLLQTVEWKKYSEQTGVPSLTRSTIEKIEVKIPPFSEQRRIAQALTALDELIAATNEKLEQMKAYKKGLMQKLFVDSIGGGKLLKINYLQISKLRFPEFYDEKEWEEKKLGECFSERTERNYNDLPLLSLTESDGIVLQEETNRKNNSNADKSKYLRVCVGDIAYNTMRMWQGRCAIVNIEGIVSPAYTICKPKQEMDSLFFYYYFKTNDAIEKFHRNSQGLVNDTLNLKYESFEKIKMFVPSLSEQHKIASCLSAMDETINAYTEKVGLLGQFKKGLMQQMFVN